MALLLSSSYLEAKKVELTVEYLNDWSEEKEFEDTGYFEQFVEISESDRSHYLMTRMNSDRGDSVVLQYIKEGVDIDLEEKLSTTQYGSKTPDFVPDDYYPDWRSKEIAQKNYGLASRKTDSGNQPVGLFLRDNQIVSWATEEDEEIDTTHSTMVVIRLDGIHTRVIGMIDSIALDKKRIEREKEVHIAIATVEFEANAYAKKCLELNLEDAPQSEQDEYCYFGIEKEESSETEN